MEMSNVMCLKLGTVNDPTEGQQNWGQFFHVSALAWVELVIVKYMEGARKVWKLSDSQYYRNFNISELRRGLYELVT